ncbi:MAG: hypothetical protein JW885_01795 [Deltaproteobacteria bacterium]|nr:hypothetical protein [Candidatus Zymogenaceae bacterium]
MKKLVALTLAALLVVGVVGTVFAADTTFEGAYRVRAWTEWNFDKEWEDAGNAFPSHEDGLYTGFFDQRFRLTVTHTRSEYLKAVIRLDIAEDMWGTGSAMRINGNAANYIDRAYIEFTVPPVGTFTVGRFAEIYGNGFTFDTAGDGARWSNAWGPVAVSLSYFKLIDRVNANVINPLTGAVVTRAQSRDMYNWDADVVSLDILVTPVEGHVVEVYGGIAWDEDASGDSGLGGGLWDRVAWAWTGNGGYYDAWVGFVGVGYTGNFADMIDLNVEASWLFGDADAHFIRGGGNPYNTGVPANNARTSLDISGWNVYADLSYYNDLFRVGVAFGMGSGMKHWWGNNSSLSHVNMNFVTNDGDFAMAHIITGGHNDGRGSVWGGGQVYANNSLENITAIKGYFEVCPIDKLTISGAVIWAKWTEDIGWNVDGARAGVFAADMPFYAHPACWYGNYGYRSWEVSDDLGWEIDLAVSYEIMEGLTYTLEGGVLFTGDSWDYEKADGTRGEWGEIWSIVNTLQYEF